jgi:hypothetical protein
VRFVRSRTFGEWIGFSTDALSDWMAAGRLDKYVISKELHHSEASIDAFMADVALKSGVEPVTVADFKRGLRLLNSEQAASILGITLGTIYQRLTHKRLSGFRFNHVWRFSQDVIWEQVAAKNKYMTREDLEALFNCSSATIQNWEKEGLLQPVLLTLSGRRRYYSPIGVRRLTRHCLPITAKHLADRWIADANTGRPFTTQEACEYLGCGPGKLRKLAANGRILYVSFSETRTSNKRYSRVSVESELLRQPAVTPVEIGNIIGCDDSRQVSAWLSGPLMCSLHRSSHEQGLEYRQACLVNILTPLLSPGAAPLHWLNGRKTTTKPLITDAQVAAHYGVPVDDVTLVARCGKFWGLRRPDGVWVFSMSRLNETKRPAFLRLIAACR